MQVVKKAFHRFFVKLIFCVLLIISAMYLGFLNTFWILGGLFIVLVLAKLIKFKPINRFFNFFEREYEQGFSGKETFIVLLGFIFYFIVIWFFHYLIVFPVEHVLLIGLIPLAFGNNLVRPIQAQFREHFHFLNAKISVEGFVIIVLTNVLMYLLILPYSAVVMVYLAIVAALFDLIPFIDSNYTVPIFTSLAFLLFFI